MMRFILILTIFLTTALNAQNADTEKITISGNITGNTGDTVPFAIVNLITKTENKIIKTELSDENGKFVFTNIAKDTYFISVSENGQAPQQGQPFSAQTNLELPDFIIQQSIQQLKDVVITKEKPYIERKEGMTVLNVENSISATGTSAFEVLEKAPSVNVDNNDNISLRGKGNILVQIDGKAVQMSGQNLANYLKGIPSSAIEKIELNTNPKAKYDASGTAIINIKMKKDKRKGTNGSITTAYGQGRYPKSNSSLMLNHRTSKINLFGNYSFAYREGFNELLLDRKFYNNGIFEGAYKQDNFLKMDFRNHIGRIGADYYINKKHTLGISANGISNKFNPTGKNVSDVFDSTGAQTSRFETNNNSYDNWHNHSVNLNHKFAIDTLGTELTTDLDYANYGNKTEQNFKTRYFDLQNNEFKNPYLLFGDIAGDLKIYALKSDLVTMLPRKIKLETGIKSSYVKADNNLAFFDISSGSPIFDTTKSNHFIYDENINAAYFNTAKQFGKWGGYFGIRVENTNIQGKQLVNNTSFANSYTQLFPSGLVSYAFSEKNSLELNYSRRISRPSYDQLNPFKFFLDPTTYKEGNPYLKPQTTHSIELTHTLNNKVFTTLSFSQTFNNITEVIAPSDTNPQVTIQTNKNLNSVNIYGLFIVSPIQLFNWWTTNNNLNLYYAEYSGTVANTTLQNQGRFTYNASSTNSFKFGKGYAGELSGSWRAREVYAFMNVRSIGHLNIGFRKQFKNSTLKLAFNDIFYTNKSRAISRFTDYDEQFKVSRDTQTAVVSYTYNFGNSNPIQRRKTGGAEDIKQRAGSGNG